jgi:hypothetical protein
MAISFPLSHTRTVQLGSEEHVIKVVAHGNNTSTMSQLVMDNVCSSIIGNTNQPEKKKKKKRQGGRVNRVRRGSGRVPAHSDFFITRRSAAEVRHSQFFRIY